MVDFSSINRDKVLSDLITSLKQKESWKNATQSGVGETLLELFADIGDIIGYYIQRRSEEAFIDTAKLQSSIINLIKLIGYTVKLKRSAFGTFNVEKTDIINNDVTIQRGQMFTFEDKTFVCLNNTLLQGGNTLNSINIDVKEGEYVTEIFKSTGIVLQEYELGNVNIENDEIKVYVNDIEWERVENFGDSTGNDIHFVVRVIDDFRVIISFGDNFFGKSPETDAEIRVEYIVSSGTLGNLYVFPVEFEIEGDIKDTLNNVVNDNLKIENVAEISGGQDEDDLEFLRKNVPKLFATGDRLVTKEDYTVFLQSNFGQIKQVNVWGEREENPPNFQMFNKVKVRLILDNYSQLDTVLKNDIELKLNSKNILTITHDIDNAELVDIIVNIIVGIEQGFNPSDISSKVTMLFEDNFNIDTIKIGEPIFSSDIIGIIENEPGVKYVQVEMKVKKDLGTSSGILPENFVGNVGLVDFENSKTYIAEKSFEIYVNNELVGKDDGNGIIQDIINTIDITGNVFYTNELTNYNFSFTSGVNSGDIIHVEFKQNNPDIIPFNHQTFRIVSKNVSIEL